MITEDEEIYNSRNRIVNVERIKKDIKKQTSATKEHLLIKIL